MHSFQQGNKFTRASENPDNNRIQHYHIVEYLVCRPDVNLRGESIAMKSIRTINIKL